MGIDVKKMASRLESSNNSEIKTQFIFPEDYSLDLETQLSPDRNKLSSFIYKTNLLLIKKSDLVLANVDKYVDGRDSGVMWEIGYATSLGIPVITYLTKDHPENQNIMIECSSFIHFNTEESLEREWTNLLQIIS